MNPPNLEEGTTFWMYDDIPRLLAVDDRGRAWVNHDLDYQIDVYTPEGRERWRLRRPYRRQPYYEYHRHLMEDEPQIQTPQYRMFIRLWCPALTLS
jgi:hypothetical protein